MAGPSLFDFLSAGTKMLIGKRVPVAAFDKRIKICEACPSLTFKAFCGVCGCLVSEKADMADEKCPLGKW